MNWLGRHKPFAAGALVALVLLGLAVSLLVRGWQRNVALSNRLAAAALEFDRLQHRVPSVSRDSLQATRSEQEQLTRAIETRRRQFAPYPRPPTLDNAGFKCRLTETLRALDGLSDLHRVRRPERFAYTFDPQRGQLNFSPADLEPWSWQLQELDRLCRILYSSRIHALVSLRRASVSTNDDPQAVLPGVTPKTNLAARAVSTPYEVVFQGFTSELSNVLSGLIESPHGFLVRNVNVEVASPPPQPVPAPVYHPTALVAGQPSSRFRPPDRYRQPPVPAAAPRLLGTWPPIPSPSPRTVLDSQLLQFTLRVDAIRPLED